MCGLGAKNEEQESNFNFSHDQNQKSPSTVFFCSETKRKRLLGRLSATEYFVLPSFSPVKTEQ